MQDMSIKVQKKIKCLLYGFEKGGHFESTLKPKINHWSRCLNKCCLFKELWSRYSQVHTRSKLTLVHQSWANMVAAYIFQCQIESWCWIAAGRQVSWAWRSDCDSIFIQLILHWVRLRVACKCVGEPVHLCFRYWLGAGQATSQCFNEKWLISRLPLRPIRTDSSEMK